MPDFRVSDTAPEHPKLRSAGLAAAGLWSMAGGYAMRELTNGWVPDYWVQTWPGGKRHAAILVKVGLWIREQRHGIDGYTFHDWDGYQRSAEQINDERERGRQRAARSYRRQQSHGESSPKSQRRDTEGSSQNLHDSLSLSLSLSPGGYVGGESSGSQREPQRNAPPNIDQPLTSENGTRPPPGQRPPDRCDQHRNDPNPPNCGPCADHRRNAERWDEKQTQRRRDDQLAVRECQWCDTDGWRIDPRNRHRGPLRTRCDHTPMSPEQLAELAS